MARSPISTTTVCSVIRVAVTATLCAACGQDDTLDASDGATSTGVNEPPASSDPDTSDAPTTTGSEAEAEAASASDTSGPGSAEDGGSSDSGGGCETVTLYRDDDMDSFGDPNQPVDVCIGAAGGGLVLDDTDCDDAAADVHPGALEAPCDGVDHDCSGIWETEVPTICPTIQAAVDVAPAGSKIRVLPGVYGEHVTLKGNDLTLLGVGGSAATTIDGGASGRPLTISSGEGPDTEIRGLTLANGRALEGGGLFVDGASPTLVDVVFRGNSVIESGPEEYALGGGAYFNASSSSLHDVVFAGNYADYYGGGLSVENSDIRLVRARFLGNVVESYGGGAAFYFSTIDGDNLVFAGNRALHGQGGGLMAQGGEVALSQVTAVRNSSTGSGGAILATSGVNLQVHNTVFAENAVTTDPIGGGALSLCDSYDLMNNLCDPAVIGVRYTDVWANSPANFFNVPDPTGVDGNIAVAPGFIDLGGPDPAQWDFRLAGGSPLTDAGDPAVKDKDNTPSDIGFHGGPAAP